MKILYNYKIKFSSENFENIHNNVAQDIYNLCVKNDGLYVKVG